MVVGRYAIGVLRLSLPEQSKRNIITGRKILLSVAVHFSNFMYMYLPFSWSTHYESSVIGYIESYDFSEGNEIIIY